MEPFRKNDVVRLDIERFGSAGEGVAHLPGGMVVFVAGALPGETCQVQLLKVGKTAAWGRMQQVCAPSSARRAPDCGSYPRCGGCQFRHADYAAELEAKRQKVADALQRIGGVDLPVSVILGADSTQRYRNKVQFPISAGKDGPRIGFYRARSHDVVDVEDCLLQPPEAAAIAAAVRAWMADSGVPAYDEAAHSGLVRHLFLRFAASGVLCCLVVNGEAVPDPDGLVDRLRRAAPGLTGVVLSVNRDRTNVVLGRRQITLWGRDWLEDTLCGLTFRISVPSFYQVNRAQTEVLYAKAAEFAALTGRETVLDLYCGIGTISLVMARTAGRVIGAEIVPAAVADAEANARRNGIRNAEFFCADAADAARRLAGEGLRPDVVCVDPPRKGLAAGVVETIAGMAPDRVIYVSCDPATLARDVARFAPLGYAPVQAVAVDLFPRTAHVETVVLLSKGEIDSKKVRVEFSLEDMDMSEFQDGATYPQIKEYVLEHTGLKVSNLYISQIKRKCGIEVGKKYNLPKSEDSRQPQCPPEKEKAIREVFKYFGMI
ncbi:MAG: 23S rRNA (uracil(1939)-C(5))-methyltransferase RlmD [Intestinimonas sp.]|uniref:23S rRNA (uracil(1939)-C(5))-methyltransferase RlmD n=1 Tax=Intestinimonas sp. TaxID=1965293 RepID=UPI002A918CF9|nr:23S rRNA (uracil(1939)-C(5))-methyltransferase RlmD [Intestinimonas sp.]MDY5340614.1 23S rRNA (uracil(1939)-C(5))-methyltransferase RlmD [Intestinimonas sp.]